jgi:hypothetical protein
MSTQISPFLDLPATPAGHFKLHLLATVFHLIEQAAASFDSADALLEQFPFLAGYLEETPVPEERGPSFWPDLVRAFEARAPGHLPLRALRKAAGLDHRAMTLLCAVGLIEEDARFGPFFDAMQDTTAIQRPTLGLLNAYWREPVDAGEVRGAIRKLRELGLVQVQNPDAPRTAWVLHSPALLWDAVRGEAPVSPAPWVRHREPGSLEERSALIVPEEIAAALARAPGLLSSGEARALVVRGPRRNGRHTVLGSVARALGRGVLETAVLTRPDDERWRSLGPLAALLNAIPVIGLDLGPGETVEIPALGGYDGPIGVVLGKQGGVTGPGAEGAITITLPMPDPDARKRHWQIGLAGDVPHDIDDIAARFRMTAGNVRRAASLSRTHAALRAGDSVALRDVRDASRALHRQALDTLATRLDAEGSFEHLAVSAETLRDLKQVEVRCRYRERLHTLVGEALRGQINPGVRALPGAERHGQDPGRQAARRRARDGPLPRRDLQRGEQVHRRDREEPRANLRAGRGARHHLAARRGRLAAHPAHRRPDLE